MVPPELQATAVLRQNAVPFVEQLFALYDARRPLVLVNDAAEIGTLPGLSIDRCITTGDASGWFTAQHPLIHDDTLAQVSYTSGTEGKPKGILLTHANLADAAERIIDQMQMTAEIREYVGVPATYSFGMGRYRAVSAVGGQAYLPPRGFDPLELARMLNDGQVNALSVVPTLLRILLATPAVIGDAGQHLRWMEIGSQHMTADEKRRVRKLFPNAVIVQHYGLTEASRSTFLRISDAAPAQLGSVGQAVGKTQVKCAADGRIMIRGPHVAQLRIDADGLHALTDEDGWLQTNDLGHFEDGYLFFDGRADDLINCGGVKIVPDDIEARLRRQLAPGAQIAVAKVPDPQRGDGVLVAVKTGSTDTAQVKDLAAEALKDLGVAVGSALHVITVDALPVTGTGKVQRGVLAEMFAAQQAAAPAKAHTPSKKITDALSLIRHEFPGRQIGPQDTFESLGGDSLHYIQFSLNFEQHFGQLPPNWETLNASQLQLSIDADGGSPWRRLETVTLTRAFFMICIVALHTDAFVYSANWGAAYFLYLLAGYSVARFQLPEIIRSGSVKTLIGTIKSVVIPTLLMVGLLQIATSRYELAPLLLISNFLDPDTLKGFLFYFIEIYVQLLVLAAIMLSFAKVRAAFHARPFISAVVLLAGSIVAARTIEMTYDHFYNFDRTPWHYAWPFALGMVLAFANDLRTRLFALGIALLIVFEYWGFTSAAYYVSGAIVLVLFVRDIAVPALVKRVVAEIASASLFIYLIHYQMISVDQKLFDEIHPWADLVAAVVIGVAAAHSYNWVSRKVVQFTAQKV
jgi:acyl-CoA synthetase (AMP-forming)/AMP-acid ligase II